MQLSGRYAVLPVILREESELRPSNVPGSSDVRPVLLLRVICVIDVNRLNTPAAILLIPLLDRSSPMQLAGHALQSTRTPAVTMQSFDPHARKDDLEEEDGDGDCDAEMLRDADGDGDADLDDGGDEGRLRDAEADALAVALGAGDVDADGDAVTDTFAAV